MPGFMNKFYSSKGFQFLAIVMITSLCILLNHLTIIRFNHMDLPKDLPEYKANSVKVHVYTHSGKLEYKLISDEAWEYPEDDRIFLKSFTINIYDKDSDFVKYKIKANTGWLNYNKKIGQLGDNAFLSVESRDLKDVIKFHGSNVDFDLNKNIFTSKNKVHAIQSKSIVYSDGFYYDERIGNLILKSNVKVLYDQN